MKTLTQERAKHIIKTMNMGCLRYAFGGIRGGGTVTYLDGITEGEDEYIREAWKKLSDSSCYMSVIYAVAQGANFLVTPDEKLEYALSGFEIPWQTLCYPKQGVQKR